MTYTNMIDLADFICRHHTMFAQKRIGGPTQTAWVFDKLMRLRDFLRKDPAAVGATFEAEMFYYDPVYRTVPTYITLDLDGEDGLRYTEVTQAAYTAG